MAAGGQQKLESALSRGRQALAAAVQLNIAHPANHAEDHTFMPLLLAFSIGFFAGLRSLTAPAAVAWAVYLGWLKVDYPLAYIGRFASVAIFSVLAAIELIADKLPETSNRTAPLGLSARIVMGGLSGACVAAGASGLILLGAVLGAVGGVAGCFLGYEARARLARGSGTPDIYIAVLEDILTIGGSLWVVSQL